MSATTVRDYAVVYDDYGNAVICSDETAFQKFADAFLHGDAADIPRGVFTVSINSREVLRL